MKTGGEIVNTKRIKDTAFLAFLNDQDLQKNETINKQIAVLEKKLHSLNTIWEAEKKILYRGAPAPNIIHAKKIHVGAMTRWSPLDKAKLLSDETCVANLHRAGFHPLKSPHWITNTIKNTSQLSETKQQLSPIDPQEIPTGQIYVGHSEVDDANHITCTIASRPLRPLAKVEQAVHKKQVYGRRMDFLENSQINYVQSTLVLDPLEVPQNISLRHGTPSVRRPLFISP